MSALTTEGSIPQLAFRLPLDPARLLRARQRIRDYLHEQGVAPAVIDDVVLAIEEAMTNAVRHSGATEDLEVRLHFDGRDLIAAVRDQGKGFDVATFDPARLPEVMTAGGRGLYLIAKLMDDLELRSDGGLEVVAVKRGVLPVAAAAGGGRQPASVLPGSDLFRDSRQRALLEEIDEAYFAVDWEYRYLFLNGAALRLSRRTDADHLGRTMWEVYPRLPDAAKGALRGAMELGKPATVEFEFAETSEWRELRAYPTSFGISVYVRDIDERKRKELERDELLAALDEGERRYRELVQNANSAILRWSADGTLTFVNEYAQELFGWTAEEAVGKHVNILVPEHESTGTDLTGLARDIVEHPERYSTNVNENVRRDGRRLWMTWTNRAILGDDGEVVEILAVGSDISDLKRAQDSLRESEEKYRAIVEMADEGLVLDRNGVQSGFGPDGVVLTATEVSGGLALGRRLRRTALRSVAALRHHPAAALILALLVEAAYLAALGTLSDSRNVLGMPGSLLALTVVVMGAAAGPLVGVAAALGGGVLFYLTVADLGERSSLTATLVSTAIWVVAALVASLLARALREQSRRRRAAAVALARVESARQAQLAEQQRVEALAADLRREREQLQTIIAQTDTSIVLLDRDFDFLLANPSYADGCGYTPDELVGLNHFDLFPHEENEAIFRRVRDSGEAVEYLAKPFEFPDQPERGTTYWDWRLAPVKDVSGRVETLVFSLVDVTERVRAVRLGDALNAINTAIAARLDQEHILTSVLRVAGEALGSDAGAVAGRFDGYWMPTQVWNLPEDFVGERFSADEVPYSELAIAEQRPCIIEDYANDALGNKPLIERFGIGALAVIPLMVDGIGIGCLFFVFSSAHRFSEAEVDFAQKVAATLSQALENARLVGNLQRVATTLQENLIHPLPAVPGLDLGRVGKAAFAPDLVGGDFGDVLVVDDSRVALLIGDVAGKGIRAAGLTETVRSAVIAYLATDDSPAAVLDKTNRLLLGRLGSEEMFVTACLVVVDLQERTARIASAGHPPPVLVSDSSAAPLALTYGVPLATFTCAYGEHEVTLADGRSLVLYTDGVTEAKRGGELFGERRVADALAALAGSDAQGMAEGLRDAATEFAGRLRDDLQILVMRLESQTRRA